MEESGSGGPLNPARRFWLWTAAITGAAFVLRVHGINRHALDLDEMLQYYVACRPASLRELLPLLRSMPLHAVLDPLLTYAMAKISRELWWLRLQPVVLATACVPALIVLARRFGDATAYVAGVLLALSVHHIEFSGFVDFYPFLALWSIVTTALVLKAADEGGVKPFAAYAAAMAGFLYTHPWAVLVMGLHGFWIAVWRRERAKAFLHACAAAGALYLPWFAYASSRLLGDPRFSYHFPQKIPLLEIMPTFMTWAGRPDRSMYELDPFKPWVLPAAALYAVFVVLGIRRLHNARRWNAAWTLAALLAFGGAPLVIGVDWVFSYVYAPRQALFALPFFLLFAAEGLQSARWVFPVLCVLSLGAQRELSRQLVEHQESSERTARRFRDETGPEQTLLFDEPNQAALTLFYYDRPAMLRLEQPRLRDGFYLFGVPEELTAGGRPVAVIWDPDSTPEQEKRRWTVLARKLETGEITPTSSDLGFMRAKPYAKAMEFRDAHASSFKRNSGPPLR